MKTKAQRAKEVKEHCSVMQGVILDTLIADRFSKKHKRFTKLCPDGTYLYIPIDKISIYNREELERLLGEKYKKGDAKELADLLIYELIKKQKFKRPNIEAKRQQEYDEIAGLDNDTRCSIEKDGKSVLNGHIAKGSFWKEFYGIPIE